MRFLFKFWLLVASHLHWCSIVNMDMYFIESTMARDLVLCYDVSVKLLVRYV